MIAIFTVLSEAQKLCDKIHNYLTLNCPGYNAIKWQSPQKSDPSEIAGQVTYEYFVSLPIEFVKDCYPVKDKIKPYIKPETDKAKEIVDKLPPDWFTNKE